MPDTVPGGRTDGQSGDYMLPLIGAYKYLNKNNCVSITLVHLYTYTHARTHARTHTHTHARTHARTHTHTVSISPYLSPAFVVNSYASELQNVVNEPIYNGNSYFIS